MNVPKKLIEFNFSYPKRKLKKSSQEKNNNKNDELFNPDENREEHNIHMNNYNQSSKTINLNQQEEDFWVDCNK